VNKPQGLVRYLMAVRVRENLRPISIRLTDQAAWSGGFFLFNMAAAFTFSVSMYAAVTVASSIGLIVAACVRAYALDGPLVAGAKIRVSLDDSFSGKVVLTSSVAGGIVAGVVSALWISLSRGQTPYWALVVLSMAIVVADTPHYFLTMRRAYSRALRTGSLYLAGGLLTVVFARHLDSMVVVLLWIMSTLVCTLSGWLLAAQPTKRDLMFSYRHVSRRMTAEALYSALGSQLGILLIYLTNDPSVTAGVRLAYSLVFAPVFMLIQGLTPLYLVKMSNLYRQASSQGIRLSIYWVSSAWILIFMAGIGGFAAARFPLFHNASFRASIPYLIPVGLSMMGSIGFDSALLGWRFTVSPRLPHRVRLSTVAVELAAQVVGVLVAGPPGLVFALIFTALFKTAIATIIVLRTRDRPSQFGVFDYLPTR